MNAPCHLSVSYWCIAHFIFIPRFWRSGLFIGCSKRNREYKYPYR